MRINFLSEGPTHHAFHWVENGEHFAELRIRIPATDTERLIKEGPYQKHRYGPFSSQQAAWIECYRAIWEIYRGRE